MNKNKFLFLFAILFLILAVNLISASLCKRSDGYYYDCNSHSGNYGWGSNNDEKTSYSKDVEEYTKTTENSYEDEWSYQKVKTTVIQKTEVENKQTTPVYSSRNYRSDSNSFGNRNYNNDYYAPASSWRYKEPYDVKDYQYHDREDGSWEDYHYNNYYYQPRHDYNLGRYNWDW